MLTRILIRLRWAMASLALLVSAMLTLSMWFPISFGYKYKSPPRGLHFSVGCGFVLVRWGTAVAYTNLEWQLASVPIRQTLQFWEWWPKCGQTQGPPREMSIAVIPLWCAALPLAGIALAGFKSKRRQPKPGQCRFCRYTLAGASICPECGRTATSKNNPANVVRAP